MGRKGAQAWEMRQTVPLAGALGLQDDRYSLRVG
jgi:hypothetical protein